MQRRSRRLGGSEGRGRDGGGASEKPYRRLRLGPWGRRGAWQRARVRQGHGVGGEAILKAETDSWWPQTCPPGRGGVHLGQGRPEAQVTSLTRPVKRGSRKLPRLGPQSGTAPREQRHSVGGALETPPSPPDDRPEETRTVLPKNLCPNLHSRVPGHLETEVPDWGRGGGTSQRHSQGTGTDFGTHSTGVSPTRPPRRAARRVPPDARSPALPDL